MTYPEKYISNSPTAKRARKWRRQTVAEYIALKQEDFEPLESTRPYDDPRWGDGARDPYRLPSKG